jgi:hypothetical protein
VIDELLTLLKIRGELERALEVGPPLLHGAVCHLEWVTPSDVAQGPGRSSRRTGTRAGASPTA